LPRHASLYTSDRITQGTQGTQHGVNMVLQPEVAYARADSNQSTNTADGRSILTLVAFFFSSESTQALSAELHF
jgi:hypothetical protein